MVDRTVGRVEDGEIVCRQYCKYVSKAVQAVEIKVSRVEQLAGIL